MEVLSFVSILMALIISSSGAGIRIDTSPAAFTPLLTRSLTLTCAIGGHTRAAPEQHNTRDKSPQHGKSTFRAVSDINIVTSIVIMRNGQDIASVSEHYPVAVFADHDKMVVSGNVTGSPNALAYMTLSWSYPETSQQGNYTCQVSGYDQIGHNVIYYGMTVIGQKTATFDDLVTRVYTQDINIKQLYSEVHVLKSELIDKDDEINSLKTELRTHDVAIKQLESQLSVQSSDLNQQKANLVSETRITTDLKTRLDKAYSGMFIGSTFYGGHTYRLTNNMFTDVASADNLCRFFGGYLAEMNDKQEYDHIVAFRKKYFPTGVQWIMLGANDKENEGTWSFMDTNHADRTANFFEWGANEPRGGTDENCMYLRPPSYKMAANYCNGWAEMLCEIE